MGVIEGEILHHVDTNVAPARSIGYMFTTSGVDAEQNLNLHNLSSIDLNLLKL